MGRGTLRGVLTAWLGLIALYTVGNAGSGRVAEAFDDVAGLIERVLDPTVPGVPDRRLAGAGEASGGVAKGEAKAGIAAGKAKGGAKGTTTDRFAGRLPAPIPN
jgi:hypothetical protein